MTNQHFDFLEGETTAIFARWCLAEREKDLYPNNGHDQINTSFWEPLVTNIFYNHFYKLKSNIVQISHKKGQCTLMRYREKKIAH